VESNTTVFGRQSASPLGLTTRQLNREVDRAGAPVNQLTAFERMELFARPLGASPGELPRAVDPCDASADLERRARAYLQVNCAHCHRFGGGGSATIVLSDDVARDQMNAFEVKPTQGSFGINEARIIRPGDPEGSVLLYRTAKLGGGRMPRVGSGLVDERGVALLGDWIAAMRPAASEALSGPGTAEAVAALESLKPGRAEADQARARWVGTLLATTRGALALMRQIDAGAVSQAVRREAIAQAMVHFSAEVRDLFERFVPDSERVARLGEAIEPASILALAGDARRGRDVFMNNTAAQCKTCHRLEDAGEPLGPDLAHIGSKYARAELLRQILEPSQTIDSKFATYAVETKAGQVFSGLISEQTASHLVLKDAQSRPTRIETEQVERMSPQSRSMMPEFLLRDLTAQQAADLLEYLVSLK
jgi:putative heme-binding domain-containing protein